MKTRMLAITFLAVLIGASTSLAKDFWTQPYEQWNKGQVTKMLNDSPWADTQTFTNLVGRDLDSPVGDAGVGVRGERETNDKFTIRFFSALPIREAYIRMYQIMNRYDEMNPQQRQDFDSRFKRALNLDVHDRVIVAVEFASNEPDTIRNMKQFWENSTSQTLKQSTFLICQGAGRVELLEYYPPSSDGTGAKFVFPRTVNGKPALDPGDREARFEFYVPPIDQKVLMNFKVSKMTYKDKLAY